MEPVIVAVASGEDQGRQVWIEHGKKVLFGRSAPADWHIKHDRKISRAHFSVDFRTDTPKIIDENSNNGTFVNGKPIKEVELANGDALHVGDTLLKVLWAGTVILKRAGQSGEKAAPQRVTPPPSELPQKASSISTALRLQEAGQYPSGVRRFLGSAWDEDSLNLLLQFSSQANLSMLVDFSRLTGINAPPNEDFLLNWASDATRSPILLDASSQDLRSMIEQYWVPDAAILIRSKSTHQKLLAHLRLAARGQETPCSAVAPAQFLLNCERSSFDKVFEHCASSFSRFYFQDIQWLFFPTDDGAVEMVGMPAGQSPSKPSAEQ